MIYALASIVINFLCFESDNKAANQYVPLHPDYSIIKVLELFSNCKYIWKFIDRFDILKYRDKILDMHSLLFYNESPWNFKIITIMILYIIYDFWVNIIIIIYCISLYFIYIF